jgi:hypothetical protein
MLAALSDGLPAPASAIISVAFLLESRAAFIEAARTGRRRFAWTAFAVVTSLLAGAGVADFAPGTLGDSARSAGGILGGIVALAVAWSLARRTERVLDGRAKLPPSDPESRDAGWPMRHVILAPFRLMRLNMSPRRVRPSGSLLVSTRYLYFAFTSSLVMFWFVLSFVATKRSAPTTTDVPFALVAIALGVVAMALGPRFERAVVEANADQVVKAYQTAFFQQIAVAETAPLVAFVGTFVTGASWLYPLGMLAAVPAFVRLAPSAANLRRIDELRRIRGGTSLYATLVETWGAPGPTPPPPPRP